MLSAASIVLVLIPTSAVAQGPRAASWLDRPLVNWNKPGENVPSPPTNTETKAALIKRCVAGTRSLPGYRTMPVLVNEDPNFQFSEPGNHLLASVDDYVSWGSYDQGQSNYQDGFQSPPVNWTVNTENKKQFFGLVKKVTGV